MKTMKFITKGRHEFIQLDGDLFRKVPNDNKFEAGTEFFKFKGSFYVKE